MPTSYRYTGQRLDADTGLYFYNARYYDPALGRFTQPDTIVPDPSLRSGRAPGDPQSLNRYSYAGNNPLRYVDPSGHAICAGDECEIIIHPTSGRYKPRRMGTRQYIKTKYGIKMIGKFSNRESSIILGGLFNFAEKLGGAQKLEHWAEGTQFIRQNGQKADVYARIISPIPFASRVYFPDTMFTQDEIGAQGTVIHELAHLADLLTSFPPTNSLNSGVPETGWKGFFISKSASDLFPDQERPLTTYARTSRREYWAEALAVWVYGQEYDYSKNVLTVSQDEFIRNFFGVEHVP